MDVATIYMLAVTLTGTLYAAYPVNSSYDECERQALAATVEASRQLARVGAAPNLFSYCVRLKGGPALGEPAPRRGVQL